MTTVQKLFIVTLILQLIAFILLFINNITPVGMLVNSFCIPILTFNSPLLTISSFFLLLKQPEAGKIAPILGAIGGIIGTVMIIMLIYAIKNFQ